MINLMKSEILKVRKSIPIKVLLLLMFGLSVVSSLSSLNYVGSPYAEEMEIALGGFDAFFSSLRDMPTITMIGIIIAGVLICADFDNRTIQAEIAAGHGRFKILFSKMISFGIAYLFVLLPYPLGRAVFQGVLIEFGQAVTTSAIIEMFMGFLVVVLVGMALNGLTILLSFVVQKSLIVIGASFVLLVLGGNALLSFGIANLQIGAFLAKTPLGFFKELALQDYAPAALFTAASISIACIIAMVALTYLLFRKAELK